MGHPEVVSDGVGDCDCDGVGDGHGVWFNEGFSEGFTAGTGDGKATPGGSSIPGNEKSGDLTSDGGSTLISGPLIVSSVGFSLFTTTSFCIFFLM